MKIILKIPLLIFLIILISCQNLVISDLSSLSLKENKSDVIDVNLKENGETISEFINRLYAAGAPDSRQALVDSFLTSHENDNFPLIEIEKAWFIYTSENAQTAKVAGDFNGWSPTLMLSHVGGTNFFFASQTFENDARLDYKLVIDDNWILDPRNTHQVSGGYGPNSECAMLDYVQPSEIQVNTESQGTVSSSYFQDETMGLTHTYSVYLPPNYSESETYPVAYFLDGNEYIQLGFAANVLDNLIYENKVQPIIGVFIDPINRNTEYAYDYNYLTMITSEFVPFIDSTYSTQPTAAGRAIIGVSLGGLTSLLFVEQYPEVFGNCGAFSPAVWLGNIRDVYNSAQNLSGKFYLDAGTYEESIYNASIDILTRLQAINADYTWKVWHEGHSWGAWRAHLDEALIYFWPMSTNSVDK